VTARPEANAPLDERATWADVPKTINDAKKLRDLERTLVRHVYESSGATVFQNRVLGLLSKPGETEEEFLARCRQAAGRESEFEVQKAMRGGASAVDRVQESWRKRAEDVREVRLNPRKTDIRLTHFGLGWVPFWRTPCGAEAVPAYRTAAEEPPDAGRETPEAVATSAE
jgi:hypothetical protein